MEFPAESSQFNHSAAAFVPQVRARRMRGHSTTAATTPHSSRATCARAHDQRPRGTEPRCVRARAPQSQQESYQTGQEYGFAEGSEQPMHPMQNPYGIPPQGDEGWGMPAMMPGDATGGWGMQGFDPSGEFTSDDYAEGAMGSVPAPMPEGPCVTVPALSLRQPFASLALYGVKQLEARNRPALKQLSGPLALHVSHREEAFGSPLVSTAVAILRRRFSDEQISSLFALPPTHSQGHGCIVGIVDVEATWPADLFNEMEQAQLTEQAIYPVNGTFITQLRNPRWLRYPVRTSGSNRLWPVQIPVDALPEGNEADANGNLICTALRDKPPLYQPGSAAQMGLEGTDDMGLGLLGGDMVRQLQSADGVNEKEKKMRKLQKALRAIEELKAKQAQGVLLEKTQEGKIEREEELRNELNELMHQADSQEQGL